MTSPYSLFEVSWEVCNMVGGIYTVISTKAKTLVEKMGDDYLTVGPWLLSDTDRDIPFDEEPGYEAFAESCRQLGLPVRIGRWRIPGSPRTILVEFSRLYEEKDDILADLWEDFEVDSISGGWDYAEPVLFGHAAGKIIEKWWEEFLAPNHRRAVAQFHEWMTGSGLLYLKQNTPNIGTVFTTHATMLGRALSSLGHSPEDGLAGETPAELAEKHNVEAKHSIEGISAREADVFTTVSTITAREAELLHNRKPDPVLPNGIDLDVIDEVAGSTTREEARGILENMASRFLGEEVGNAAFFCISGRYEFHNKGIDLLIDALAQLSAREGRGAILFVLVPAGNSGLRSEVLERMETPLEEIQGSIGIATHNLFDEERDPVQEHCKHLGFTNEAGSRIKIIQVPIYLSSSDGFLNLPYEAVLRAMDLSCFPSYYEPWGYTPQESLALGVPTITTDFAGFGRWAQSEELSSDDGITVLPRMHLQYAAVQENLASELEAYLRENRDSIDLYAACRASANRTHWSDLVSNYVTAFDSALGNVQKRLEQGVPLSRRPKLATTIEVSSERQAPRLVSFDVSATLPKQLEGLKRLARNYWWSWDAEGARIFEELSPGSWRACGHNPVSFLQKVFPEDLEAKAAERAYVSKLERVVRRFEAYVKEEPGEWSWSAGESDELRTVLSAKHPVAYFSAEFGIHESLRVYSGGLGILAGDHLKSASDLNIPLVAVGLFYHMGYMGQRLSPAGEQLAIDIENDPHNLPMERVQDATGKPLSIELGLPGRKLSLAAWRVEVGRVTLYLLDTDVPQNRSEDREITRHLYGGDEEMRLRQEIVLGRGGIRLLRRLGIEASAYHINEGHAALLALERVGALEHKEGMTFEEAREFVRATTLFTTHTPVPAGHDRFSEDLMRRYFSDASDWVGVPWERFFALGQSSEHAEDFNMTYLALNFASICSGVSKLHGIASRSLLHSFWPGLLEGEVPVRTITNGIHLPTWTHPDLPLMLGVKGRPVRGEDFAKNAGEIDLAALWGLKQEAKRQLLARVKESLERSFLERHDSPLVLERMLGGLDDGALLIGFARRFAPYKRAHLIFKDSERLAKLLTDTQRPLRILVAGKAHPNDQHGLDILKSIVETTRRDDLIGKVLFIEDYDIELGRALVQGVDVWLNNPIRMLEASGTSGMKAAANGALNLSIGDGWWPEAFDGKNGWMIGDARVYDDQELQDQFDSSILYQLLEEEVLPLYFERDKKGLPSKWLEMVRHNLETIPPVFNTDRMVSEYLDSGYRELAHHHWDLGRRRKSKTKTLARDVQRIRKGFSSIRILSAQIADLSALKVGDSIDVRAEVDLGDLGPEDVSVELVLGHAQDGDDLDPMLRVPLESTQPDKGSVRNYEGHHRMDRSGNYAYGIRVRAQGRRGSADSLRGLVLWA